MLPAIVSQLVVLLKDTALGFIIQLPELLYFGKQIGGRLPFGFPYVPSYLVVAAVYIGTCGLLSWFAFWLQKRLMGGPKQVKTTAKAVKLSGSRPGRVTRPNDDWHVAQSTYAARVADTASFGHRLRHVEHRRCAPLAGRPHETAAVRRFAAAALRRVRQRRRHDPHRA